MSAGKQTTGLSEDVNLVRNDSGYMCLTCFVRGSRDNIANHCAVVHDNANYDLDIATERVAGSTQTDVNGEHGNDQDSTTTILDTLSLEDISSDDEPPEDAVTPVTKRSDSRSSSAEPER